MTYERPTLDRVRLVALMDGHISCPPGYVPRGDGCVPDIIVGQN
jgi:hypothetical protein